MKNEQTLRDTLAMSMPHETMPALENREAISQFAELLGFGKDIDIEDMHIMTEFSFVYQSYIRYKYADAMLKQRNDSL